MIIQFPDYMAFKLIYYPLIEFCEKNLIKHYKLFLSLEKKRKDYERKGVVFY